MVLLLKYQNSAKSILIQFFGFSRSTISDKEKENLYRDFSFDICLNFLRFLSYLRSLSYCIVIFPNSDNGK